MNNLLIENARVVTPASTGVARGSAMGRLRTIEKACVRVEDGVIHEVSASPLKPRGGETVLDASGRAVIPGFVDCHTHACWAGDRLDEWELKLKGSSYLDILRAGGGIMSTVRAVRAATEEELANGVRGRLGRFLRNGTTTVEIKSGYGLTTEDELKMLRACREAANGWPGTVALTALLGHAKDADQTDFVERTIHETLPAMHAEFPDVAVDAYCEGGAWSLEETERLLRAARGLGHPVRLHADQFTSLGGVGLAVGLGARSVDHLEATTESDAALLGASGTVGVGLPLCGMHLDGRYADLGRVINAGGAVAVATNCNPGSAPGYSLALAGAMAVRHCGLTWAEALTACTVNGAAVLGLNDRGAIVPGARGDFVVVDAEDERMLFYELGDGAIRSVVCGGRVVHDVTGQHESR